MIKDITVKQFDKFVDRVVSGYSLSVSITTNDFEERVLYHCHFNALVSRKS